MSSPTLVQVAQATGQKFFTLAFVLGSSAGCVPIWGGTIALNDSRIAGEISALRAIGGDVAVSFGGAAGPYLSSVCGTQAQQASAYEQVIDAFNIKHIDFDVEASIPIDTMNKAIAQVQRDRPGTVVSYTLEVVADDFGLVGSIGTDVLTNAVANGVNVGIVNPMTMDYGSTKEWGDSVIAAAQTVETQMAQIWPTKTTAQLYAMLGVTPMIGRNDTGPIFSHRRRAEARDVGQPESRRAARVLVGRPGQRRLSGRWRLAHLQLDIAVDVPVHQHLWWLHRLGRRHGVHR